MTLAFPYRVAFLAPTLELPADHRDVEPAAALLIYVMLFEYFSRHPRVTMPDADDYHITDNEDVLLNARHPTIDKFKQREFMRARRDDILWFELGLDPARPSARLKVQDTDWRIQEFSAIGAGSLSQLMQRCLQQWEGARGLPSALVPLEEVNVQQFLQVSRQALMMIMARGQGGDINIQCPPVLGLAFSRLVYVVHDIYTYQAQLSIDPQNPWALRDKFLDEVHQREMGRDDVRKILKLSPNWVKPCFSMFGDDVEPLEQLSAASWGAILAPNHPHAHRFYAQALERTWRYDEAYREAERAVRLFPHDTDSHLLALNMDTNRLGQDWWDAMHRIDFVERCLEAEELEYGPDITHMRLAWASAHFYIGRLDEAIAMRDKVLEQVGKAAWPNQTKLLQEWQSEPERLTRSYAREAFWRGDPGRVLEGYGAIKPITPVDWANLIHALVRVGKEDFGVLAYAQARGAGKGGFWGTRLAGALAYLAKGELAPALDEMYMAALGLSPGTTGQHSQSHAPRGRHDWPRSMGSLCASENREWGKAAGESGSPGCG